MTEPLDIKNFKYDLASIGKYCDYMNIDKKSRENINSIFKQCDTEDANGRKVDGGDGELNKKEQTKFKAFLEKNLPNLYDKFSEFFVMMDIVENKKNAEEGNNKNPKANSPKQAN